MDQVTYYAELLRDNAIAYAPRVLGAILLLWLGFKLLKKVDKLLTNSLTRLKVSDTMRPFIISMVNTALKLVLILIAVSILGVELSGLVTVVAAMGFAIGLSLQGSLGNFASGILILFLKPYKVHDWIQVDESFGKVEEIGIFNSVLVTPGNKTLIVPNSKITDGVVTNYSEKGWVRLELNAHMPYEEDFPRVQQLIADALMNTPFVLNEPAPEIGIESFDSHNVILAIRPYVLPDDYWEATFEAHKAVKRVFHEHNIRVAYSEGIELGSVGA
ncbi:mechanosensitive ion channel family protein [Croceitalea vernalis]|uniref:Mechanosensitive ion channel family protein n=1 Tax=Croceitalea vernalis TaxID=3075599 RepID=A0ABU3BH48_9FLAO|nr:mechanosensitive ion channel family protein [Croceitalea sp. P007]MDT0621495.1 mechanosensitive ion channel family protein [Croceitalea sp. P007]